MSEIFRVLAERTANMVGSYWSFTLALLIVVFWAATGPIFSYSDTWQLLINTGTTIVTFLMVFLLQNTQNREKRIVMLELNELLRGVGLQARAPDSSSWIICQTRAGRRAEGVCTVEREIRSPRRRRYRAHRT